MKIFAEKLINFGRFSTLYVTIISRDESGGRRKFEDSNIVFTGNGGICGFLHYILPKIDMFSENKDNHIYLSLNLLRF